MNSVAKVNTGSAESIAKSQSKKVVLNLGPTFPISRNIHACGQDVKTQILLSTKGQEGCYIYVIDSTQLNDSEWHNQ